MWCDIFFKAYLKRNSKKFYIYIYIQIKTNDISQSNTNQVLKQRQRWTNIKRSLHDTRYTEYILIDARLPLFPFLFSTVSHIRLFQNTIRYTREKSH